MNEDAFCEAVAEKILAEHAAGPGFKAGPFTNRLGDIFKKLRGMNIPWTKILALIGPILQILTTGGDWTQIIAAVLALFLNPVPTA